MFPILLLLSAPDQPDNSGYFFIERACVAQNDGHDPVFWWLGKGECEAVAEADAALDRAYRRALASQEAFRRKQLRNAQRHWIKTTIAKCELDPDGTVLRSLGAECYIHEAESRTAQLQKMHQK